MTAPEYRKLCKEVHAKYGKPLNMPYWESCSCVDDVYFGECTKERLFKLLDMAVQEEA